jgi:hypothetical protein
MHFLLLMAGEKEVGGEPVFDRISAFAPFPHN